MRGGMAERSRRGEAGLGRTMYLKTRWRKKELSFRVEGDSSPRQALGLPVSTCKQV